VSEEHGSGHHIRYRNGETEPIMNVPGVTVWAKTGTAQAPPLAADHDCDGQVDEALDNPAHAWFVGLVGPSEPKPAAPRYAITVVVEYGGSGGRTAGPVANEIVRALVAERYLPEPTP
jgi:penicillin-binding protein 2